MIRPVLILMLSSLAGCSALRNGIDIEGHVRPAKTPEPVVVPAPPKPPPPDDWAPPWFHRPKLKFLEPNPKSLNANPIPKVRR